MTDNRIIRILTTLCDFLILNILWLVCSVPVITAGASTTALYSVMFKIIKKEEGYIIKSFLKAFRQNFKQSTIIWLLLIGTGCIVGYDWYIAVTYSFRIIRADFRECSSRELRSSSTVSVSKSPLFPRIK